MKDKDITYAIEHEQTICGGMYRYPKEVIIEVNQSLCVPPEVKRDFNTGVYGYEAADDWMSTHGESQLGSIKKYFEFLYRMYEKFININQNMGKLMLILMYPTTVSHNIRP